MTHILKVKESAQSKALLEYLRTLSYVEFAGETERKLLTEAEMIAHVRKAEKSKKIKWEEAKKIIEKW